MTGIALQIVNHYRSRIYFSIASAVPIPRSRQGGTGWEGGRININRASVPELMLLPKIGKKRAESIMAYRNKHGPLKEKKDLLKVKEISVSVYRRIEEYISVR